MILSLVVRVNPIMATTHQRAQVHADLLDRWPAYIPPAIINLVDRAIPIQAKGIRNINLTMHGVSPINHLQFVKQLAVTIH